MFVHVRVPGWPPLCGTVDGFAFLPRVGDRFTLFDEDVCDPQDPTTAGAPVDRWLGTVVEVRHGAVRVGGRLVAEQVELAVLADELGGREGMVSEQEYRAFVGAAGWDCDSTLPPRTRADRGR